MRTVVYLRVSTDLQDVASQRFELKVLFAGQGWVYDDAVEYAEDEGVSGGNTDRPKFKELCADISAGTVGHVVVYDMDRLSRDFNDRAGFVRLCMERGCKITELAGVVDTSTPGGLMLERIKSALAEFQRMQTAARTSAGVRSRMARGEKWGGARKIGGRGFRRYSDAKEQEIAAEEGSLHAVGRRHRMSPNTVRKYRLKWPKPATEPASRP